MSNVSYIFAQIFGLAATILLCSSYLVKNKKLFLFFNLFGDTLYGLTFICVNSWGAGIISFLSCIQCLVILFYEKKEKQLPKSIALMFILGFIGIGLSNFNTYWDIIPILTYIWFTVALYLNDLNKIRFMYLIANMLLTVYDIMVKAYSNALEDGIESSIIVIITLVEFMKSENVKRKNQNSATLKGNQLGCGVIGVKNFDLQSATPRMQFKNNHNAFLSNYKYAILPCPIHTYG